MKRIAGFFCLMTLAIILFSACDKIEGNYYEISNKEEVTVDFPELNVEKVYRKILIDEFTGHMCNNCPQGHATLEDLHQMYGDTLVAIGIHYTSLARPFGSIYSYDFRTEEGNALGEYFEISGIPAAVVNRVFKSKGWPREQWFSAVAEVDRTKVPVAIQMINQLYASDSTLKTNVKVTLLQDCTKLLKLYLYLTEDGVVKPQKNGTEDVLDYTHNHVLRSAFNMPTGYLLSNENLIAAGENEMFAVSLNYSKTDWNIDNCSVIALVVDAETGEAIQVESLKIK